MRADGDLVYTPTAKELHEAHAWFEANEPRGLFYRVAVELVELALGGKSELRLCEALAVLLQTWNAMYYRFRPFGEQHLAEIEGAVKQHDVVLRRLRRRKITTLRESDKAAVEQVFQGFEAVLGPVGAAKSLHLLAPRFFPLWDRKIAARGYHMSLRVKVTNAPRYWAFMGVVRQQCQEIESYGVEANPLKALDEFNYWRYTKKWSKGQRRDQRPSGRRSPVSRPVGTKEAGTAGAAAVPTAATFRVALEGRLARAARAGHTHVDANAADLHREVGGYPGPNHRMATCYSVMMKMKRGGDEIISAPPKGKGASLTIRYRVGR